MNLKNLNKEKLLHTESITQNVLGLVIAFMILKLFGMSTQESILIQSVFFVTSYLRSYCVRKFFSKYY